MWEQDQCVTNYKTLERDVLDTMMCAGETNRDSCQVINMHKIHLHYTGLQGVPKEFCYQAEMLGKRSKNF